MQDEAPEPSIWRWLTRIAFAIAVVVVIARAQLLEFLRDPFEIVPGGSVIPRGPGPSTSLVLDLIAAIPAILVAARAAFDPSFRLRKSWGNLVMLALAVWVLIGAYRSDDRFAGINDAAHVCAALSLLWATQQTVRSWRRLRLVAAFAFGLLLVYVSHAVIDKLVELPIRQQNAGEMLKSMDVDPDSYQAKQLEKKIASGELLGFAASINTFGAMLVTLGIVAAGAALHCSIRGKEPGIGVLILIALGGASAAIYWTDSRTALATPLLAGIALAAMVLMGGWLSSHRKLVYFAGVLAVLAGTAVLIGVGLKTGGLILASPTFRWWYWVGSFHVWLEKPLLGVGFDSFQFHYLTHRLPIASEEIKDPHNFVVRAFAELGLIGGLLTLLWVARGFWDMMRPALLPAESDTPGHKDAGPGDLAKISLVCIAGVLLAFMAAADWDRPDANLAMDAIKRLLFLCVLTIGTAVVALKSLKDQEIDDRPVDWIRGGMTIAVAIFLVHNLIDFSMFEISAMFPVALIAGATWGAGLPETPEHRGIAFGRLAGGVIAFVAAAAMWTVPTILAESSATTADDLLRGQKGPDGKTFVVSPRPADAVRLYKSAWEIWPTNADYAFRAARASTLVQGIAEEELASLIDVPIAINPNNIKYLRLRAQYETNRPSPRLERLRPDYDRILKLDPNSIDLHLEYAAVLQRLGQPGPAREQYQLALRYNDALEPNDPRRIRPANLAAIQQTLERLGP